MKKFHLATAAALLIIFLALPGYAHEDTKKFAFCRYCKMDREKFGHTRLLIKYSDGTSAATCSIQCSALDLVQNRTKIPCRIMVGDYGTKKLIDATVAFWVIGGDKPGVMTDAATWAFENQTDAEAFFNKHGGKRATFQEALREAYNGLYEDMKRTIDRVKESKSNGWNPCGQQNR